MKPTFHTRNKLKVVQVQLTAEQQYESHIANFEHSESNVMKMICDAMNINSMDMFDKSRVRPLAEARYLFMYWLKQNTTYTKRKIGNMCKYGGLDHTTVIHGIRTIRNLIETDSRLRAIWVTLPVITSHEAYPHICAMKYKCG